MKKARRATVAAILLGLLGLLLWIEGRPAFRPRVRREAAPDLVGDNAPSDGGARSHAVDSERRNGEQENGPRNRNPRELLGAVDVRIRVMDVGGAPAAGALVRLLRSTRKGWTEPEPVARARTEEDGRVRLRVAPAEKFRAHAQLAEREGWVPDVATGEAETVVQLERCLAVKGRVTDSNGAPLQCVEVLLSLGGPITGPQRFLSAYVGLTDESGVVSIPHRETHPTPYYRITARGYRTAWGELDRDSLLRDGFEIRLERLATVAGRFLDKQGRPVEHVNVVVLETMQAVLSKADGRFLLPGLPTRGGTLVISPRRHGALLLPDTRPHGETTDLGDIVLGAGQSISGRVLAEDGTAAAGLYVWARSERTGLSARAARTGADGRFEIAGLADGTYLLSTVVMRAPKGSTHPRAERANVAAGAKRVTLTLHRPPLLQVDLVSRASGRSVWVHRIEVRVTPLHGGAVIVRTVESKMRKRRSRTITLTLPAAGTYEVAVRTSDHAEQTMEVEIGPNEHRVLAVELPTAD